MLCGSGELALDTSESEGDSVILGVCGMLPNSTHGASNAGIL
jgi:hypothetical protein